MVEASGQNLVFLLSTPRAGSTLLGAILGNHPEVFCPNEPWLLLSLYQLDNAQEAGSAPHDEKKARQALRELLSEEEFNEACRAFALRAYNQKLAQAGKSIFVDKTPRYYHILPFLQKVFPDAKKIWLKRNPLDVAASFQSTWKTSMAELVGAELSAISFDLTLSLSNFGQFFQGQRNTFELRYEDLVEQPREMIGQLCAFLQIAPEAGLENYGSHCSNLASLKGKTMGDKNLFKHSHPHSQSVGRWQAVLSRRDVRRLLDCIGAGFFERMGYTDTVATLKTRGFKFPDPARVEQNLTRLRQAGDCFGPGRASSKGRGYKRDARLRLTNDWWQRLGQRVGITRQP